MWGGGGGVWGGGGRRIKAGRQKDIQAYLSPLFNLKLSNDSYQKIEFFG